MARRINDVLTTNRIINDPILEKPLDVPCTKVLSDYMKRLRDWSALATNGQANTAPHHVASTQYIDASRLGLDSDSDTEAYLRSLTGESSISPIFQLNSPMFQNDPELENMVEQLKSEAQDQIEVQEGELVEQPQKSIDLVEEGADDQPTASQSLQFGIITEHDDNVPYEGISP